MQPQKTYPLHLMNDEALAKSITDIVMERFGETIDSLPALPTQVYELDLGLLLDIISATKFLEHCIKLDIIPTMTELKLAYRMQKLYEDKFTPLVMSIIERVMKKIRKKMPIGNSFKGTVIFKNLPVDKHAEMREISDRIMAKRIATLLSYDTLTIVYGSKVPVF